MEYPPDISCLFGADINSQREWPEKFKKEFEKVREFLAVADGRKKASSEFVKGYLGKGEFSNTMIKQIANKWISVSFTDCILSGVNLKTFQDTEDIVFYNTDSGIFQEGGEIIIRRICRNIDATSSMRRITEIIDKIKTDTFEFRENFDANPHLSLRNGVLDLNTGELQEHSPDLLLTRKLNIVWNPDAIPKCFIKFILEVAKPDDVDLLCEILAWCLIPSYFRHKIFILIGKGSNGKTTLLRLFAAFLGSENVTGIPIQDFDTDQYAASYLLGKFANICADVTAKELSRTGKIKQLSGGDTITVNVKYGHRVTFINACKLIFAANVLPAIRYDDTDAIWRRIHKIDFIRQFEGKNDDPELLEKLTTPEELSGLLNIVVAAYRILKERRRFVKEKSIKESKEEYILRSNPIHAFALWGVESDKNNRVTNPDFFDGFLKFCRFHKIFPTSQKYLTENFQLYRSNVFRSRGSKSRYWKHIRIRDDFSIPEKENSISDRCDTFSVLLTLKNIREYMEGAEEYRNVKSLQWNKTVTPVTSPERTVQEFWTDTIIEIIEALLDESEDEPISVGKAVSRAIRRSIPRLQAEERINELTRRGIYFEPQQGYIKRP